MLSRALLQALYATLPGPLEAVDRRQMGLLPIEDEGE